MRRPSRSRAVVALVVAALFVTPAAALSLPGQSVAPAQTKATNDSVAPGAQFAGVVGVGQAELDGAVEGRAFGQAIAQANSNQSKAAVVAGQVENLDARLAELNERRAALQTAYENGSLDRGEYRAKTAVLAARIQQVERQLNRSQSVAVALPPQARTAAGLNVSAIESLRSQAGDLRGGEVAEIARGIAGRNVGSGIPDVPRRGPPEGVPGNWTGGPPEEPGPPDDPGPPEEPGQGSERGQNDGANRTSGE